MSVDNHNVIDAVGIDKVTGEVVLTIADHFDWDEDQHLLVLQEKINRYLAFIESGEILTEYPKAIGKPIRIDICCKYSPSEMGEAFLTRAQEVINKAG